MNDWPQAGQRKRKERDRIARIEALPAVIHRQYSRNPAFLKQKEIV
jgi:hypothetical protein